MSDEIKGTASSISRKEFLVALGVSAAGVIATVSSPNIAFAEGESAGSSPFAPANTEHFRIVTEEEIDRMWEEAIANAKATGGEIVLNEPHPSTPPIVPYNRVSATVQGSTTVGGIPDNIYLLAVYENSQNQTRISKVYDKYAYGFHSTCEHGTYSHVIGDGGRTLIVNATVTLRSAAGLAQSFRLHGEFGPKGGSYLNIAYI